MSEDRKSGIEQGFPWVEWRGDTASMPLCGDCKHMGRTGFPCCWGHENVPLACAALNPDARTRSYFQPKEPMTAATEDKASKRKDKDEPRLIDISLRLWGLVAAFERLTEHCAREAEKYPPGSCLQGFGYEQIGGAKAYAMARESLERELTAAGVPREGERMETNADYVAEQDKLCPLMSRRELHNAWCMKERCAWWHDGKCAIVRIAQRHEAL